MRSIEATVFIANVHFFRPYSVLVINQTAVDLLAAIANFVSAYR